MLNLYTQDQKHFFHKIFVLNAYTQDQKHFFHKILPIHFSKKSIYTRSKTFLLQNIYVKFICIGSKTLLS